MRALLVTTAIAAGLYGGYWFVGSHYAQAGVEQALAKMKAEGRADYGAVTLHGFPSRFDMTIDAPRLTSADGSLGWQAPFLQLLALSYRPNRLIAVWPHEQTLTIGSEVLTLATTDLRANLNLMANTALTLDTTTLEGKGLVVSRAGGGALAADHLVFATRQAGSAAEHEVAVEVDALSVDAALRQLIDPAGTLPPAAEPARLGALVSFDRPLDRTLADAPAQVQAIHKITGHFGWGPVQIDLGGDIVIDANRDATGQVTLSARQWREALALAVRAGAIPADKAPRIESLLGSLAGQSGEPDLLKLPLTLSDGLLRFGPLPLAPLPKF